MDVLEKVLVGTLIFTAVFAGPGLLILIITTIIKAQREEVTTDTIDKADESMIASDGKKERKS